MDPDDIDPFDEDFLWDFAFALELMLSDMDPLDIEPLDIEPFDIEPLDIEPLELDCAKAPVEATAPRATTTHADLNSLFILHSPIMSRCPAKYSASRGIDLRDLNAATSEAPKIHTPAYHS